MLENTANDPYARRAAAARSGGFTLIELMVAIALSMIITFCITFVSSQAQRAYESTTAKVEVYQKFRYALADVQENLANMVPTANLEFFIDLGSSEQDGYWEDGEEIRENGKNLGGGRRGRYDEGAHVVERHYDLDFGDAYPVERHDNFSLYFKTVTQIGGIERVANVEYYLADREATSADDPGRIPSEVEAEKTEFRGYALRKVVRYIDIPDIYKPAEREVVEVVSELCQNVTDFKVEYFARNLRTTAPGRFVTPRVELDGDFKADSELTPVSGRDGGGVMREFLYGGFRPASLERGKAAKGRYDTATSVNVPFYFWTSGSGTAFSELNRGDKIFLWSDGGGSNLKGEYTIKRNENGKLYFQEDVNSALWKGDEGQIRFRAGYVPSAFRISLRVLNDRGAEARLMTVSVTPFRKNN
ncbi:MAG: prepilin-type N-terminal cleavage/methylation domain-containing protein [Planctomycetota bacterium]